MILHETQIGGSKNCVSKPAQYFNNNGSTKATQKYSYSYVNVLQWFMLYSYLLSLCV